MENMKILALFAAVTCVFSATNSGPTYYTEDVYIKLLRRVENLEKRDQQQQAEIDSLRGELNTEKQRTSALETRLARLRWELNTEKQRTAVLENRLTRLCMRLTEHRKQTEPTTEYAELKPMDGDHGDSALSGKDKSSRKSDPEIPKGKQPSRVRRQVDVPVVAFHATLTNHTSHIGLYQGIAFDRVVTNIGTAYNPHVGLFVAPVSGVYVFHTTLMGYSHNEIAASIAKNGVGEANLYVRGVESISGSASAVAVLYLNKGDDVMVQHQKSDKTVHGYHYSMFSGFLLRQDYVGVSIVG